MSKAKDLRDLREGQSLHLRKRILKSSSTASILPSSSSSSNNNNNNNANQSNDIFQVIADSTEQYAIKLANLQKFRKKNKNITEEQVLKFEWIKEQNYLQQQTYSLEKDITGLLEIMILHNMSDIDVKDIVSEYDIMSGSRIDNHKTVVNQLKELKLMIKETTKSVHSNATIAKENVSTDNSTATASTTDITAASAAATSTADTTVATSDKYSAAISIVADLLMQIRYTHNKTWNHLKANEVMLKDMIKSDRRCIYTSLKIDTMTEQNDKLKREFLYMEDDDGDVDIFMEEWIQKLSILDESHQSELRLLKTERDNALNQCNFDTNTLHSDDIDDNDTSSLAATGGWSEDDHDVFTKIYRRGQLNGSQRNAVTTMLQRQLPHKSQQDISIHEVWYRAVKAISNKKKDLLTRYTTTRDALIKEAKDQLEKFRDYRRHESNRESKLKEHEEYRHQLHSKLVELKDARKIVDERLAEEERLRLLDEVNRERIIVSAIKAEAEEAKAKVQLYKEAKNKLAMMQEKILSEQKQSEETARKKLIEENKWKVDLREQVRIEKEEDRKKREHELVIQEQRRLEWLSKLAEQVPYWEAMQNAQSKLDHVTASAKGWEYVASTEEEARGHIPMNGFADKRIIRDARLRLAVALRDAGVAHTFAAKQAVQQLCPRPHLAIHGLL